LNILRGHKGAIRSVKIAPDDSFFVSGADDMTIRLWEIDNNIDEV